MSKNFLITDKIKKLREKLKLSQERFGKKIGISGKTVSAYERGLCIPSMSVLEKISNVYDSNIISLTRDGHDALINKLDNLKVVIKEIEERLI